MQHPVVGLAKRTGASTGYIGLWRQATHETSVFATRAHVPALAGSWVAEEVAFARDGAP